MEKIPSFSRFFTPLPAWRRQFHAESSTVFLRPSRKSAPSPRRANPLKNYAFRFPSRQSVFALRKIGGETWKDQISSVRSNENKKKSIWAYDFETGTKNAGFLTGFSVVSSRRWSALVVKQLDESMQKKKSHSIFGNNCYEGENFPLILIIRQKLQILMT